MCVFERERERELVVVCVRVGGQAWVCGGRCMGSVRNMLKVVGWRGGEG